MEDIDSTAIDEALAVKYFLATCDKKNSVGKNMELLHL